MYFPKLRETKAEQILFSKDCFTKKDRGEISLEEKTLSLTSALFKKDAVVLSGTGSALFFRKKGTERGIYMEYPTIPILAFGNPMGGCVLSSA